MKSRYLLGAVAALAVAFGCAEANAQFGWIGGPYPTLFYVGPEGGWTNLSNQKTPITTVPFRVDTGIPSCQWSVFQQLHRQRALR